MLKLTFADVKSHKHELYLTAGYTLALLLVYSTLAYAFSKQIWVAILIAILFLLGGVVFCYVWISFKIKKESGNKRINKGGQ